MMNAEILDVVKRKGLLLEKEIYDILNSFQDTTLALKFLEQIEQISGKRMITRSVLKGNVDYVQNFVDNLESEKKNDAEKVFFRLGISLEITGSVPVAPAEAKKQNFKVFYSETLPDKKLEVKDFVGHFRSRYQQLQRILMARRELQNGLVSINKISSERSVLSIIGIVTEKNVTKNKNLILTVEDLTGMIKVLVKYDRKELFTKAEELLIDDVVGIKASGSRDILFAQDIVFPDSILENNVRFEEDYSIGFISDLHCGNLKHLKKSFQKFLDWLNTNDKNALKIKYLFFVGDNVDGAGIYPGQEADLELNNMVDQYKLLASYIKQVPKRITMFMCPGQHDACRVAEPQPLISKKYASELYEIENLILVTNPTLVKLIENEKEFKVLMYHGASVHTFINGIKELRDAKAHSCPAKVIRHMLKRRHLAPPHSQVVYIPNINSDPLVIPEIPNVLCTGEVHRLDIENYNGTLGITGSCWQSQTSFEEKVGNIPDPCKVPVLNLKSKELKIFYFGDEEEVGSK